MEATTSAVHATADSMWLIWGVAGPASEVLAVRDALEGPLGQPIQAVDVTEDVRGKLLVAVRWARPPISEGPAIEHLLSDVASAGALLRLRVQGRRVEVRAAANDGEMLLRFYQAIRSLLASRYAIRLLRMGDARGAKDASRDLLRRDEEELLELALARGYYDEPKRCGVRELGDALGFSKSVVARKLRTLERRALEQLKSPQRAN